MDSPGLLEPLYDKHALGRTLGWHLQQVLLFREIFSNSNLLKKYGFQIVRKYLSPKSVKHLAPKTITLDTHWQGVLEGQNCNQTVWAGIWACDYLLCPNNYLLRVKGDDGHKGRKRMPRTPPAPPSSPVQYHVSQSRRYGAISPLTFLCLYWETHWY